MELPVDLFGKRARNAFDARQIVDARRNHAAQAAEARKQPLTALCADPFELLEPRRLPRLGALRAHPGDREAVRLVADLRNEHQRRALLAEFERRTAIGENQRFETDLAAPALRDTDEHAMVEAQFAEPLPRDLDLPLAAIDQYDVRKRAAGR